MEAATTNESHWLDYLALVMRALPDGLHQNQQLMLRAAFDKAWTASSNAGFERGIAWSRQVYGTWKEPPQPATPEPSEGGAKLPPRAPG